jgi:transforming growth factor-beta-induced protein
MNKLMKYGMLLFVGISLLASCKEDDPVTPTPQEPETITEIAAADDQFSTLVSALQRVSLDAILNGTGPFTVFAPTNDAFANAGIDLATLTDQQLTEILLYHVIPGEVTSSAIADGKTYVSSSSNSGPGGAALSLLVEKTGAMVKVNNVAEVVTADIDASNGVIHVVNAVLQPLSISGHAAANTDYSTLVGALVSTGLAVALETPGPFTVFAPDDAAFSGIDLSGVSTEQLTAILLYHSLSGQIVPSDVLQDGFTYATTASPAGPGGANLSLVVEKSGSGVKVNNAANVKVADIIATNGIIHSIDAVLFPLDVVGHAAANPSFSELVGALAAAEGDLVTTLQGDGPFTVFAPVNSAFEAISDIVAGLSAAELRDVLLYHVASGNVTSDQLSDGQVVTTVQTGNFTINIGTEVTITDNTGGTSTVVLTDVQGTNGVIHVIDRVLLP